MYTRTNSMTLSIDSNQANYFAYSRAMAARSKEPEIFTFERIPAQASPLRSYVPIRPKKRCTRVMYPAKVRMYLPPEEKSPVKRWLIILCLVVLWQIYTEEPCLDSPLGSDGLAAEYQLLSFQSPEEQARQFTSAGVHSDAAPATLSPCADHLFEGDSSSWDQIVFNTTCPSPRITLESGMSRSYDQRTPNGYVVALLVYHRLGGDN